MYLVSSELKSCMGCTVTNQHPLNSVMRVHGGVGGVKVIVLNDCRTRESNWSDLGFSACGKYPWHFLWLDPCLHTALERMNRDEQKTNCLWVLGCC